MRRLFWVGVGALGAVVAARKLEERTRPFTPEGVADRVDQAREQAGTAVTDALRTFRTARLAREQELVTTLLVTPEGGDASAVLRRGRRAEDPWDAATPSAARPRGRVDEDEPLYEF
jgi:hypothetical protein